MSDDARLMRRLALPVYVPTLLQSAGLQALAPVIPLVALELGFSVPAAAALAAIGGVGMVAGPIPIGRLMSRIGERLTMIVSGALLVALNVAGWWLTEDAAARGPDDAHRAAFVGVLVMQAINQPVWLLGRQAFLGGELPTHLRARGMSTFGGMMRVGMVAGPAVGAAIAGFGHPGRVLLLDAAVMAVATALVWGFMVPGERRGVRVERGASERIDPQEPAPHAPGRPALASMLLVGLGMIALVMGRAARPVILPLVGATLGLDAATISVIFAVAAIIEIGMFVPAGLLMDRRGRAAVTVPCLALMAVAYLGIGVLGWGARPGDAAGATWLVGGCALVLALGNGFSAGIQMTLGVDLSPERARTAHLARWNTIVGAGQLAAPALVGAITLVAPVAAAGVAVGASCAVAAVWLGRLLPRVTPGPARRPDATMGP